MKISRRQELGKKRVDSGSHVTGDEMDEIAVAVRDRLLRSFSECTESD